MIGGAPEAASHYNPKISNAQAQWLKTQGRCFTCHKPMLGDEGCGASRGDNPQYCPKKGKGYALRQGDHGGQAPGWDGK